MVVDVLVVLICLLICILLVRLTGQRFNVKLGNQLALVLCFHLLITLAYYYLTTTDIGNDSLRYWNTARQLTLDEAVRFLTYGRSTQFIFGIVYFLSGFLSLSYFACTMIFSTLGFIALRIFFHLTFQLVPYNSKIWGIKLFPLVFLLPNLHFWCVGVGKDTLVFLAVALFLYSFQKINKRTSLMLLSCTIFILVRPHVLLMLLLGFGVATLFSSKTRLVYKVCISLIIFAGSIMVLPKIQEMTNLDSISVDTYSEFAERRAGNLSQSHTSSAVDISSYPFPLKVVTFLFRPTFIDINGAPALIAAFENLLLLIITIRAFSSKAIGSYKAAPLLLNGMLLYCLVATLLFSMILGNLGIMLRMKNMILPCLLMCILWNLSYLKTHKAKL